MPPLALVCVDKKAESHSQFEAAGIFAVNFLAFDQQDVSQLFATSGADKFSDMEWAPGTLGAPILAGTIAHIECRIAHAYDGGDHTILVGEITAADASDGAPLVYFRGAYRQIGDAD